MTKTGRQIANLMMDNNKSAADITHAVKVLGNGSMQSGLSRIGSYFSEEVSVAKAKGLSTGRMQGGIVGILGTAAIGGILYYNFNKKYNKKDAHETEGHEILHTLEETVSTDMTESSEETFSNNTYTLEPSKNGQN